MMLLSIQFAFRFVFGKKKNRFVALMIWISMIGIALGMTTLITVLSVMNGYDHVIRQQILSKTKHITVYLDHDFEMNHKPNYMASIQSMPGVQSVSGLIEGQAILMHARSFLPIELIGVDPQHTFIQNAAIQTLKPHEKKIVLGVLNPPAMPGHRVALMLPDINTQTMHITPHYQSFRISRIASDLEAHRGYIHMHQAKQILHAPAYRIAVMLHDPQQAPSIENCIKQRWPYLSTGNWTQDFAPLFHAIQMEKTMMSLILFLIIMIAAFHQMSGLLMMVHEKQQEISILKTMGYSNMGILQMILWQSMIIGGLGVCLGCIGGITVASHISSWFQWFESIFDVRLMNADIYYIDYLPSKIDLRDVFMVSCVSWICSVFSGIIPSLKASKLSPADVLRYT